MVTGGVILLLVGITALLPWVVEAVVGPAAARARSPGNWPSAGSS